MPTPGTDCHFTLTHSAVNSGNPYGFILETDPNDYGPSVIIQRENNADGTTNVRVFFTVLLADDLTNPNGSQHTETKADMYSKLAAYLSKGSDVTLTLPSGVVANIGATGHSATEAHYGDLTLLTCQFLNIGEFDSPINAADFTASLWRAAADTLTWATSYWR